MITAFHDVQGEQSTLSSRIETPGDVRVVEVFTEQQVRLALISVDVTPPVGPSVQSQLVALSDGRSLELTIRFDGLGLHAEVAYFDPALAGSVSDAYGFEDVSIAPGERQQRLKPIFQVWDWAKSTSAGFVEKWRTFISPPAWGGAFALAFFLCVGGIVAYRLGKPHLDANEILDRSVLVETADLQGKVEHQLVRIGEIAADGNTTHEGTIELWKDSKRHIRRLYDAEHRLIASEWKREDGQVGSYAIAPSEDASAGDRELLANAVWKQDISASSFRTLSGRRAQVRSAGDGYELTSASMPDGPIHLVSAVLVLDRQLRPIKETLRLRGGSSLAREVRFVVTNEERKPIAAVPDAVFNPMGAEGSSSDGHDSSGSKNRSSLYSTLDDANAHAVELQIAVLSQLNQVGADTMDPIDVTRTPDGHIRVFGTVAGNARRQRITAGLQALPDSQLIDIHLGSQHDMRTPSWSLHNLKNPPATIYAIRETRAPVDDILRRHFGTKGWSSERVDSAVAQFSQTALDQARRALQHAYALDRLSRVLSADDAESVSPGSKRQWAAMVAQHAEALESEFQLLHDQLHQIQTVGEPNPVTNDDRTERAAHDSFTHSVNQLLLRTQYMNQCMGAAFATGTPPKPGHSAESLLAAAADSIPVHGADRISKFAFSLAAASEMADQHGASGDRKF